MVQLCGNQFELNKQVFGLLFFNVFFGLGGSNLVIVGENIVLLSVSILFINQFNWLVENYVEGVDFSIGVDFYIIDVFVVFGEIVMEVNFGLFKQLFNDWFLVQVGGNLGMSDSEVVG